MRTVVARYKECSEKHKHCSRNIAPMPKRVVDLGENDSVDKICLRESEDETASYIALSHSWGGSMPDRLITSRTSGSQLPPFSEWPQTFQDAFTVTKALGIRYIWIDVVCIHQADEEDWAIESSKMAAYYGNAALVIAASIAANWNAGCFALRNPLLIRPSRLQLSSDNPAAAAVGCLWVKSMVDQNRWAEGNHPLHRRGWVLQEEMLARRLVKYTYNQVFWGCIEFRARETMPWGFRAELNPTGFGEVCGSNILHFPLQSTYERNIHYDAWNAIVVDYTQRNLTYQKDTLPGLSGVANIMASRVNAGDSYLSGIWRGDLVIGLLWAISDEPKHEDLAVSRKSCDDDDFLSPSWSWSSISRRAIQYDFNSQIVPGGDPARNLCRGVASTGRPNKAFPTTVLDASTSLKAATSPYGEVTAGTIRFSTKLARITIDLNARIPHRRRDRAHFEGTNKRRNDMMMHAEDFTSPPWRQDKSPSLLGDCIVDDLKRLPLHQRSMSQPVEAFFLPLLLYTAEHRGQPPERCLGIALVPSPTGRENEFVRIGRASVDLERGQYAYCSLPQVDISVV